jgi:hypothetical protein
MVPTWLLQKKFYTVQGSAHGVMYDRKVFCRQLGEKLFPRKIALILLVWYHNTPFIQFLAKYLKKASLGANGSNIEFP